VVRRAVDVPTSILPTAPHTSPPLPTQGLAPSTMSVQEYVAMMQKLFDTLDVDGSGLLGREELVSQSRADQTARAVTRQFGTHHDSDQAHTHEITMSRSHSHA
jgi:Ca2+-binding EF-hand superfamily protein